MPKLIREKGADSPGIRSFALEELLADRFSISCDEQGCLLIPAGPATADNFGPQLETETPEVDPQKTREELDREACELGFEQGHRDGLELARQEMASKIEGLEKILEDLSSYKARIFTEAEGQLLELTLALAEVVIRHEVRCQPETVRATLQEALQMAAEQGKLRIRIHPEDLENIKEFLPQLKQRFGEARPLELQDDLGISQGGCLVESDSGMIDGRLEEQLEALRQQLHRTWELRQQGASSENPCD